MVNYLSTAPEIDQFILVVPASPSAPDPRVTPLGPSRLTLSFETLVSMRKNLDVIVTDNLFGDIITDLAGAVGGGIGTAASANLNTAGTFPSMFEPVHGSAPDIAGKGIADPTAAITSMVLLLENHGRQGEAAKLQAAIVADVSSRAGSTSARSTAEIGAAIRALL